MIGWFLVLVPAAMRAPVDGTVTQKDIYAEATESKTAMAHFVYPKQNFSQHRKCLETKQFMKESRTHLLTCMLHTFYILQGRSYPKQ